jgi:hypothetical protein
MAAMIGSARANVELARERLARPRKADSTDMEDRNHVTPFL